MRRASRQGAAFVVAQLLASGGNFGFHIVATRLLGPGDYGLLGSLLVLIGLLSVPAAACTTLLTGQLVRERGEGDARTAVRAAIRFGLLGSVLTAATSPLFMSFLHIPSIGPMVWVAIYVIPLAVGVVPLAILCAHGKFAHAGIAGLGAVVVRIGLLVACARWGWGLEGALAATALAEAVKVLLLWWPARGCARVASAPLARQAGITAGKAFEGTGALAGLWLLLGADTLLARHLCDDASAGAYAVAATIAKLVFFATQTGCMLAVPRFAAGSQHGARSMLRLAALSVACLGTVSGTVLVLASGHPWARLLGAGYPITGWLIGPLVAASSAGGILWLVIQYRLARGRSSSSPAPWAGVAVLVVCAIALRPGPVGVAMLAAAAATVAAALAWVSTRHELAELVPAPREAARQPGTLDLTVVVPFYNPGDVLRPNLLSLIAALREAQVTFEVITVADGCTDGSQASIADLDPAQVRRLELPRNSGKGAALRLGLREGSGRYVGFIDADGDLDPALWQPFLGLVRLYEPDIVIGSKRHPLSEIDPGVGLARRACSRGYQLLVRTLFPALPVTDTQVGIKLFRRDVLARALPLTVERRFVFDLELLLVAWRAGDRRIMPAPVTLRRTGPSTVSGRAVWRMFADTLGLAWRFYVRASYDAPVVHQVPAPRSPLAETAMTAARH